MIILFFLSKLQEKSENNKHQFFYQICKRKAKIINNLKLYTVRRQKILLTKMTSNNFTLRMGKQTLHRHLNSYIMINLSSIFISILNLERIYCVFLLLYFSHFFYFFSFRRNKIYNVELFKEKKWWKVTKEDIFKNRETSARMKNRNYSQRKTEIVL